MTQSQVGFEIARIDDRSSMEAAELEITWFTAIQLPTESTVSCEARVHG
jgi:hypothetical protein